MACDRFVNFPPRKRPSYDDIKCLVEDYVRGLALQVDFTTAMSSDKDLEFWSIQLPGHPSFPFKRVKGFENIHWHDGGKLWPPERWFEVVVSRSGAKVTQIDVITRLADEITSVVAEGLVSLCVRNWKAKVLR